ncbi:MAG: DNA polymerase III subunit gamma/tau [Thermomicrobiales bacterium]
MADTDRSANGRSQSLYRKYRPVTFAEDDLVGQDHVSRTLRNAVRHDRVAHAYLFCGPRGSGKTSSARLLAKAVNCEAPDPADRPCNKCASCRVVNEGRAVDIIEIDAASNRGIEDMRDLREKVRFAPAQLKKKFYIIDEVHQLTKEASNALLKTLEEPPPHAAFILATTDPEKVLETISSRCQTFVFHRIPVEKIIEHLRRVSEREGIKADDGALTAIARAANGALRDALGLLDQLSAYGDDGITAETVRQVIGAGGSEQVIALVDAIAANDVAAGLRVIDEVVTEGADARSFAAQVVEYLRALLHATAAPARGREHAAGDVTLAAAHFEAFNLGEIAELVKRFSQVDFGLRHSAYGHLPLELCLVECVLARTGESAAPRAQPATPRVAPREDASPANPAPPTREPVPFRPAATAPRERAPELAPPPPPRPVETRPVAAAPAPPAPTPEPPANAPQSAMPNLSIERVHELWPRLRQGVRAINRRIEALLASADPYSVHDGVLTLVATYPFHRDKLNQEDCRAIVEEVIAQVFGAPYRLACVTQEDLGDSAPPTAAPAQAGMVATTAPVPAPVANRVDNEPPAPADDEPPWEPGEPPIEHRPAPRRAANGARPPVQASALANTPGADERYLNAVRNIFNAIEVKA